MAANGFLQLVVLWEHELLLNAACVCDFLRRWTLECTQLSVDHFKVFF